MMVYILLSLIRRPLQGSPDFEGWLCRYRSCNLQFIFSKLEIVILGSFRNLLPVRQPSQSASSKQPAGSQAARRGRGRGGGGEGGEGEGEGDEEKEEEGKEKHEKKERGRRRRKRRRRRRRKRRGRRRGRTRNKVVRALDTKGA
jgi:hypothetical protein